jgi:hypothetical protein
MCLKTAVLLTHSPVMKGKREERRKKAKAGAGRHTLQLSASVAEAKEQGPDTDSIWDWELELEHRQPQDAIEISASAVSVGRLATTWCPNTFVVRNSLGSKILGTGQSVPMQNRVHIPSIVRKRLHCIPQSGRCIRSAC